MRRTALAIVVLLLLALPASAENKPILVVYDFTSTFDKGAMGQWVAEVLRGHALRSKRYVGNPKITVDEILAQRDFHPDAATAPDKLAEFTKDAFSADLFVYGSVEQDGLGYKVLFRVFRVSKDGKPEKVLEETKDCPAKQFVPLAVDDVLNRAAGVQDPPTEWKLLAEDLKQWSQALDPGDPDERLSLATYRDLQAQWQDKLTYRYHNVIAPTHRDFANEALIAYFEELLDGQKALMGGLAANKRDDKASKELMKLADCCSRSIVNWLDDASAGKRWKEEKNLIMNGDFEVGQKAPANWEPLKEHMSWVDSPEGKQGKCVKFDMPEDVAATYGMLLYSQSYAVEEGATYRIRWRFRTNGPAVKLFIKGYDEFHADFGFAGQDREVWRSRKDPQFRPELREYRLNEWTEYGHDFVPFLKGPKHPKYIRLMFYAYWPKGVVWWDDIVVKKIKDAPMRP
jgi:hypothetical protein